MTPERFQQIEELYHAARETTAEERAALLAQTDPELRREIESLLAKRTGGDFMDRPAIQNAPDLLEDLEVIGVDDFTELRVKIALRVKTVPSKQWRVARELRRRIKKAFDTHGIEFL